VNSERARVRQAKADFDATARELRAQRQTLGARLREPHLSTVIGTGLAVGFVAALFPLRAWPRFAANVVRVGATLARSLAAPALIAFASKKYLHSSRPVSRNRSQ